METAGLGARVYPRWEKDSGNFPDFFKAENDRPRARRPLRRRRRIRLRSRLLPSNKPSNCNRPLIYSHLVGEAAGRDHRVPSERESGDGELHFTPDPQNRHLRHVRKIFRFLDTLPLSANSQNFSYKAFFDFFAYPSPHPPCWRGCI